jgi:ribosomal protein L16 Arg81 hydroxylase
MLAESSSNLPAAASLTAPNDWSPEQETALLLDLCEAQMEAAMRDSDSSVDHLVKAFTDLVDASRSMSELAGKMPPVQNDVTATELNRRAELVAKQVNEAIVAFQFYDKLSQRMGHVRHSLTTLALFVCNRKHTQDRDHWHKLLTSLRRLYRTQEELAVFDLVAEGATADAVRAAVTHDETKHSEASSVELF